MKGVYLKVATNLEFGCGSKTQIYIGFVVVLGLADERLET